VALIPIVSSGRALRLMCLRWKKAGRLPDAVIVEGPLAGGHLGWKTAAEIDDPANSLERLLPDVLEVAADFGGFPVIAAGGVFTHDDIQELLARGASGVQMGTRFLATEESGATTEYKRAVVQCRPESILVAQSPGSPCGLPFRVLAESPMYRQTVDGLRKAHCNKGYLTHGGRCLANESPDLYFCICNGLLSSGGYNPEEEPGLFTVGANASRVDRVVPVAQLMEELRTGTRSARARGSSWSAAA
jgi:nitronate monooxygenase